MKLAVGKMWHVWYVGLGVDPVTSVTCMTTNKSVF